MTPPEDWSAAIDYRADSPEAATRLYRVLLPEASREVPRTRVTVVPPVGARLKLEISARDTGALRAALQTYLGWIQLTEATTSVATRGAGSTGTPPV